MAQWKNGLRHGEGIVKNWQPYTGQRTIIDSNEHKNASQWAEGEYLGE